MAWPIKTTGNKISSQSQIMSQNEEGKTGIKIKPSNVSTVEFRNKKPLHKRTLDIGRAPKNTSI